VTVAATTRELQGAPGTTGLLARAAVPLVPLASRLPFVAGGGGELPDLELVLRGARAERDAVAAYARVCGLPLRDALPPAYPHVLAFPLHLALMTDARFPFPAIGLVHVANAITVHRPTGAGEPLDLDVRASGLRSHPRGRTFALVTQARAGTELVWEETSTLLRRGGGDGGAHREPAPPELEPSATWRLPGHLGRRYAAVSGDRNPIHLHGLTARAFGFERPIAHGMWTLARCLAALDRCLPAAFTAEVTFRRPILLPATVAFASGPGPRGGAGTTRFTVRDTRTGTPHLDGTVRPVRGTPKSRRTAS
jgi:acyl dehydratase